MTIAIAGKNSIAIEVTRHILSLGLSSELCVVINRTDDGQDGFQPSFKLFAKLNGLKVVTLEELYQIEDLVFLSMEFDRIIKPEKFASDRLFNIHFSKLPSYKGMYTSALPIFNGESQTGVTFHRIDRGIDTGDIIAQCVFDLEVDDTARSLYHKYLEQGTSLVKSIIGDVLIGNFEAAIQPSVGSSYYSKSAIDYTNISFDLSDTAWGISCKLRAFMFREYQMPKVLGHQIVRCEIADVKSSCKAGTVVVKDDFCVTVATIDYDIVLHYDLYAQLMECCRVNDAASAEILLSRGVNIEERTKLGWTPLMVASYNSSIGVVHLLLDAGADVNATNYKGTSVLMYAKDGVVKSGDFTILKVLVGAGADVKHRDYSGRTVLDYVEDQNENVFDYLKRL